MLPTPVVLVLDLQAAVVQELVVTVRQLQALMERTVAMELHLCTLQA
jgi:hypothetical protein